ncbi:MAG TPA: hypothetical protein VLT90_16055 [Terriglobales bacterium]|nr:hypothetical protein [Terriglobales bacterium]
MKKVILALLVSAMFTNWAQAATVLKWKNGWGSLTEPLDFKKSKVTYSINAAKRTMTVSYKLVGATPNKLYGVGLGIFCTTFPSTFGQFPTQYLVSGNCTSFTFQGVTKTAAGVAFGVVLTDINGSGSLSVTVGPIAPGTYQVEFAASDGVFFGCGGTGATDFQSPGPVFGDATTITIP